MRPLFILTAAGLIVAGGLWQFEGGFRWPFGGTPSWSPAARLILGEGGWSHLEGACVVVHAQRRDALKPAAAEADFACDEVGQRLRLPVPGSAKAHLFLITDSNLWERTIVRGGLRPDGLSWRAGQEIFLLRDEEHPQARLLIPHEMIHLRLGQAYPAGLPLWLEEGLAQHLAWEIAQARHGEGATLLVRSVPALGETGLLSPEELTNAGSYPADAAAAQAFYRQSEEWVRALSDAVGPDALGAFVRACVEKGGAWRDVLRGEYGWDETKLEDIESRVRRRVTSGATN